MRLQNKVLLAALPLAAVFAGLTAYVSRHATESLMVNELGRRVRPEAEDFAAGLARNWEDRREGAILSQLQQAQAFFGAAFVEALSADGLVLGHTNVLETGRRRDDADARAALSSAEPVFARAAGPRGPLLVLSAPVWKAEDDFLLSGGPQRRLGTLRIGLPLDETLASAQRIGAVVAGMSVAFCVLALGLILVFVRALLLRPILAIAAATSRVAAGDYGAEVPVHSSDELGELSRSFNAMGATLSRTVVSRDRLEEALAISRATLDASADGILVVDQNLRAITYNRRFVEMYGIPDSLIRAGDVRGMAEYVKSIVEEPERFLGLATSPVDGDQERSDLVRLKDGRIFDRITHAYLIGGAAVGRTITTRDMTLHFEGVRALAQARDVAEEALAISRATIDASADGILVVGEGAKLITHNRRFIEMWNIPSEMVEEGVDNVALAEYVMPQLQDGEPFYRGVVRSDEDFPAPERRDLLRLKDGRVFERVSRPYLRGGQATGRTLTYRDLTLHLEGLRALSEARDEALETARVKSEFLANVSHEIRTPLNAVIGSAEMLLGTRLDAEQREHTDNLNRASRALLELVNGVLDFAKIEAGRMTVERSRLHPAEILCDAAALLAPRAAEKGLALKLAAGDAERLELLGDPTRLRQVLLNLLSNAVKFTDRGGVEARIAILSSDEVSVELEFSVCDTGIGILAEHAGKIFTPFIQGDGSTTRRFGGTGLGLAISRTLVELMGGTIGFETPSAGGARFWFRLRLDYADASTIPAAPVVEKSLVTARRDGMRILVVDDNQINRRLLQRQLERLGCPSIAAESGPAALEALGAARFGLVLLDCQMPGLDGYATAVEIRLREAGRRRTPIVAITANATKEVRKRCEDVGMDDFVPKPATLRDLAAVIERWDLPFDETALSVFASVAADSERGLATLLADFVADARARLDAAHEALSHDGFDACRREAHAIKGAAAAVGARGLAELCRRLEDAAVPAGNDAARETEAAALLSQVAAEISRLEADASRRTA